MWETIKTKLSSRKFWIGAAVVIMGIVMCCWGDTENGMTLIGIGAVSYLGAEGLTDIFGIVFQCEFFNPGDVAAIDSGKDEKNNDV